MLNIKYNEFGQCGFDFNDTSRYISECDLTNFPLMLENDFERRDYYFKKPVRARGRHIQLPGYHKFCIMPTPG